jgi:hypothetical protein
LESVRPKSQHHSILSSSVVQIPRSSHFLLFLLSNDVEAGGGTNFPELDLTVMPKRGRVLIWPSVLDDDPNEKDDRTDHQALPVEAGKKYGANAWLHMRDFKVSEKTNFFCLDTISVDQYNVSVQLKIFLPLFVLECIA